MWVLVPAAPSGGARYGELRLRAKDLRPVLLVILAGDIALRNLVRGHFGLVRVRSIFHTADDPSLERLPFFEQLLCALRIRVLKNGNALKVPSSHTGARSQTLWFQ